MDATIPYEWKDKPIPIELDPEVVKRRKYMPASTIYVNYSDGSPCSKTKVVLGFNAGMTKPAYTDNRGTVTIEHSSTGNATVYVSGKKCGTFHAPGRTSVTY
ncbi:hypothetical protein QUF90_22485 [Desulfococcaceae bacterium HSG9]|nr:hypothetical protein [Desulfococcaceae bacterium HSG9]